MADLLASGLDWLADQLLSHSSRTVTYQRGAASVSVAASVGRSLLKLGDSYGGVRMEWTDRDYLIRASDLVLNGAVVLPARGDQVLDGTAIYEVLAPGSEPVYRTSDPYGALLRIHTKRVN